MKVTVIPIVIGSLEKDLKSLEKILRELDIRRRIKTTQTTSLLKSARILRIVLETRGDLLSL